MRLVGAVLILGGCTGLGLWYKEQLSGRVGALRTLSRILEMLMSEIRYGKATLSACCKEVADRVEEPYKSSLKQVYWEYNRRADTSFQEIFVEQMNRLFTELPIKKEERECFLEPFQKTGFQDGQMQIKCMEQSRLRLDENITKLNQELREKSQMAIGLGVMSGLLLVVIML